MAWRVARVCPRRARARRERRPGRHGRVLVWPMQGSSSTTADARRLSRVRWSAGTWWPGSAMKERGGGAAWPACGRHGHAMHVLSLSLGFLCWG